MLHSVLTICARGLGAAVLAGALAAPAMAQIVVVPLDPVDPDEVVPGDPGLVQPLPDGTPSATDLFNDGITPDQGGLFPITPPAPRAPGSIVGEDVMTVEEDVVATGTGAVLRGLDKLAGTVEEMELNSGETTALGWLQITLGECRYPEDNPSGDAYAWLVIREEAGATPVFEGWMMASSPALNALDHARFDVWVINCTTE
ncbi:hypothetical protein STA1M1_10220 [Sinisalibacter aestuarii]|uniref:DUF2155 domain-containing protein n=2 Tax=Sinisalibacter aestuarii TaxID=2949426 RepID=A0ABQ5LRC5_9RHOB|nr:hypothetical protein STA1M1_10220 [Sinisalibacter aestuarii]